MLAKFVVPWSLVVILAALPGGAAAAAWPAVNRLPAAVPGLEPSTWPVLMEVDGELAALYLAESDNRVTFRRGDQAQTLDLDAPAPGGKYFKLHQAGRQLYALWWNPTPNGGGKWLYVRASADGGKTFGPLRTLNTEGAVLADYQVAADGAGNVVVIFQDERAGYGVYVNRSTDGGLTWLENDIRLDGPPVGAAEIPPEAAAPPVPPRDEAAEPTAAAPTAKPERPEWLALTPMLVYQNGQWLAVWQQLEPAEGDSRPVGRWLARTSTDGGLNWAPAVEIARLPDLGMTEMVTLIHQGQVYVIGFVPKQGMLAFRSADMGRQWTSLGTLPIAGPDQIMSYLSAVGADNNVVLSYTTKRENQKLQVAAALIAGGAWQTPLWRLDRKDKDYSKAAYQNVAALPNGAVIAVWEDYRYILPAIYMDYSSDGGKTWLAAPRLLTEPGRLPATTPRLVVGTSKVWVIFDQWRDAAARGQRDAAYLTLPYQADSGLALPDVPPVPVMSMAESVQRIRQRSQELWTLRVQGKFAETWDYFNPVFRAMRDKTAFLLSQGQATFNTFELLGEPIVDDIFGVIPVKVTYIPPYPSHLLQFPNAPPPPRTDTFPERWMWFYDDWYMVPEDLGPKHLDY